MIRMKKIASLLLALAMLLSLTVSAFAADTPATTSDETGEGSIIITNATIGETYHVYRLFTATYGDSYTDSNGNTVVPTVYIATAEQKAELEAASGNVFEFTAIPSTLNRNGEEDDDTQYRVTVGSNYTDEDVVSFVASYVRILSSSVTACYFPGATEMAGSNYEGDGTSDGVASASTVVFNNLPLGYYFVTSSLGSVVSLTTTNPEATIVDKNTSDPDWDNNPDEPEDDDPVKDVVDPTTNQSIDDEKVSVGKTLEYQISFTNTSGETLSEVVVYDAVPEGTEYTNSSIALQILDDSNDEVTTAVNDIPDNVADIDENTIYYELDDTDGSNLTWTIVNLPDGYTLIASFKVTVKDSALQIDDKTVVNNADVTVTLGDNTYYLKTNTVENPVGEDDDPVKDVKNEDYDPADDTKQESVDGTPVSVGDILTYTITYTNPNTNTNTVDLTIVDAPPTGTVYVKDSANSSLSDQTTITIDEDGNITWFVDDLNPGATVTVYFQVEVTEAALSITDNTITNSADFSINSGNYYKTNTVENPTEDEPDVPDDENFGKVIINADGTETTTSTGSFGDTVKFDISIDATNQAANDTGTDADNNGEIDPVQVSAYYIYDKMGPGFTLNEDSFTLTINGAEYTVSKNNNQAYEGVTTYTIYAKVDGTLYTYVDEDGYTIIAATIPWVNSSKSAVYPNCEIHLTYTATINENAEIASTGNVNTAVYDYSTIDNDNPYEPDPNKPSYPSGSDLNHESTETTTTTYTYALGIQKISQETGEALEGAEFSVVDAGDNTVYGVPVYDNDENVEYYNYTSDITATGATATFTTNTDGQIIIKGVDIGTYTFTEIKAPNGYVLLTDSLDVAAKMESSSTSTSYSSTSITRYFDAVTEDEWNTYTGTVYTKDSDGNFTVASKPDSYTSGYYKLVSSSEATDSTTSETITYTFDVSVASILVENAAGTTLPGTGGVGTTIFYIVGSILVLGAVVLLITRKRMRKSE